MTTDLDAVFKALADRHRRVLLDRLRDRDGQTLSELCDGLDMTRQAVSKHLGILLACGLVTAVRQGREKVHHLNPAPIHDIHRRWISRYDQSQLDALANLKAALEKDDD